VEKFLKIDIKENFVSWIGDEVALLQIQSHISKGKNDLALVLKTNNADKARTNLDFVVEQVRKKTPVKFKAVNYKGYEINFLSIKGFFKMLLGGRFNEFDKPYFTQIDDYVVFSDSPNTLKGIIEKVTEGEILATSTEYIDFNQKFDPESSVFIYSNVPLLFDNMYALADAPTKQKMRKNKDFIICFPQIGLQLSPKDDLFENRLVLKYEDVEKVKKHQVLPITGNNVTSKSKNTATAQTTDAIFNLKPIYPNDLNAKTFIKKYNNGNVRFQVELKDGLKHGKYEEFYTNGTRKIRGRFRKDEQVGTWRYYDEDGLQVHKKRF
jgi:antitoxin component YwqK of YwqJK toxin-antitoxin module